MNICFFDATPRWSGGANRVFLLAKELSKKGYGINVCCLPGSRLAELSKQEKFSVTEFNPKFDLNPFVYNKIRSILTQNKIDVVDINSPKFYWLASKAAKSLGIKVILTRNVPYRKTGLKKIVNKILYNTLADVVVTISHKIKSELIEDYNIAPDKIKVIYDGIDFPDVIVTGLNKYIAKQPNEFLVGVVSRIDQNKGLECLVQSVPLTTKKLPNVRFVIVGSGTILDTLKKTVSSMNLDNKIVFTGFISEEDKYKILSIVDATVVPSATEGISRSCLESMLYGKPVIATTTSSISEIIIDGKNGILVEPNDPAAIADGIYRLLNSD
jgi:glycosyltransferase involved in cell wall biosynthesis